ncbi:right-handed parallel beta-helix repeat-containing protein [Candidatus Eisenbacteria bacterium]|uniref:Right-handed parallel beta-helix repeat-containing protein n=1 Tax=Eiseniibacteriota bacterium TaxID=2212470 RepID=A0ABV6YKT4_UNCEI
MFVNRRTRTLILYALLGSVLLAMAGCDGDNDLTPCVISSVQLDGESPYQWNETIRISWESSGSCEQGVEIHLLVRGEAHETIVPDISSTGDYDWQIRTCPFDDEGELLTGFMIRVVYKGDRSFAESEAFDIDPACMIENVKPDGDDGPFCVDEVVPIAWSSSGCCSSHVKIELIHGSDSLMIAEAAENTGAHGEWKAEQLNGATSGYRIRITDQSGGDQGISAESFTISPVCTIENVNPDGDDGPFCVDEVVPITWRPSTCCSSHVRIELIHGSDSLMIAEAVENTGTYSVWKAEQLNDATSGYRIRITDQRNGTQVTSAESFTIDPACTIEDVSLDPQGPYCLGDAVTVTWSATRCCADTVVIELHVNDAPCVPAITDTVHNGASTHTWIAVQCGALTIDYQIKVSSIGDAASAKSAVFAVGPVTIVGQQNAAFNDIGAALAAAGDGSTLYLADGIFTGTENRDLNIAGKSLEIRSSSGLPEQCVLDCAARVGDPHQLFTVQGDGTHRLVLEGLTIRNSWRAEDVIVGPDTLASAAVCCLSLASIEIHNCTFASNVSRAVSLKTTSSVDLWNCIFQNNGGSGSLGQGGALRVEGSQDVAISECLFAENKGDYGSGATHLRDCSNVRVSRCEFRDNSARHGGAIGLKAADALCNVQVEDSWFVRNGAAVVGGAIRGIGGGSALGLLRCVFAENESNWDQETAYGGGAVYSHNTDVTISECTFYANRTLQAPVQDRGVVVTCRNMDVFSLQRTIITQWTGGDCAVNFTGTGHTVSCTCIYDDEVAEPWACVLAEYRDINGNISLNPLLCDPDDGNVDLRMDSPCVAFSDPNPDCDRIGARDPECR